MLYANIHYINRYINSLGLLFGKNIICPVWGHFQALRSLEEGKVGKKDGRVEEASMG